MSPKVSVIIPVYKVEPYIRQAFDSVINQTYRNLQIILVDDGSPDNCGTICDEYAAGDNRVTVIHKENGGVSSARNAGINVATGEWIYFMDSDDWIDTDTIELCVYKAMETNVDMVLFDSERFDDAKRFVQKSHLTEDSDTEILYDNLQATNSFLRFFSRGAMWLCLVKGSIIKDKLLFDEDLYLDEDTYFRWKLYLQLSSYLYIPRTLYHYRDRPNSAVNNCDVMRQINGSIAAHIKITDTIVSDEYPADALKLENGNELAKLIGILANILPGNTTMLLAQKREIVYKIINMDVFKIISKNYNWDYLGHTAKIFIKLKRFPVFAIYLIHYLKKAQTITRIMRSGSQ